MAIFGPPGPVTYTTTGTTSGTGGYTYTSPSYMTSTGPISFAGFSQTVSGPPLADTVSVTADGMLLVDAGGIKIKVPHYLFKDLVALAEMGLLEKMVVPEGADDK